MMSPVGKAHLRSSSAGFSIALFLSIFGVRQAIASGQRDLRSSEPTAGSSEPSQGSEHEDQDACIDEHVKADLFAKRQMRGTRERLFQQTNRHELMIQGGYYVSDLFEGTYVFGGAYAYHMTEDLAIEAAGSYTRITSSSSEELERIFSVLGKSSRRELIFNADLIWAPAHGKLRIGGSIDHFDLYLAGGAGVIDSALSSDLAANGGFGLKFFLGRTFALRIDVRDYFYRQQLLSQKVFVNDLTTTLGVSLYLPVGE
jgi:outer membrane beta-barrel protein